MGWNIPPCLFCCCYSSYCYCFLCPFGHFYIGLKTLLMWLSIEVCLLLSAEVHTVLTTWYLLVMLSFCKANPDRPYTPLAWPFTVLNAWGFSAVELDDLPALCELWKLFLVLGKVMDTLTCIQLEVHQLHRLADPSVQITCTGPEGPPLAQESHWVLLVLPAVRKLGKVWKFIISDCFFGHYLFEWPAVSLSESRCFIHFI